MKPEWMYMFYGTLGMGVVTFFIRVLPFLNVVPKKVMQRLEARQTVLTPMFLTLLAVYCLAPATTAPKHEGMELLGSTLLVAGLHWWKRNLFLSLGVGTGLYLWLIN